MAENPREKYEERAWIGIIQRSLNELKRIVPDHPSTERSIEFLVASRSLQKNVEGLVEVAEKFKK